MTLQLTEKEFENLLNLFPDETNYYEDEQDYLYSEFISNIAPPYMASIEITYTMGDYERTIRFTEDDSPLYPDKDNLDFDFYPHNPDPNKEVGYVVSLDGKKVELNNVLIKQLENKVHKLIDKDWKLYK